MFSISTKTRSFYITACKCWSIHTTKHPDSGERLKYQPFSTVWPYPNTRHRRTSRATRARLTIPSIIQLTLDLWPLRHPDMTSSFDHAPDLWHVVSLCLHNQTWGRPNRPQSICSSKASTCRLNKFIQTHCNETPVCSCWNGFLRICTFWAIFLGTARPLEREDLIHSSAGPAPCVFALRGAPSVSLAHARS